MAVFMGPRNNYVLGRFDTHAFMSWMVSVFLLMGFGIVAGSFVSEDPEMKKLRPAAGVVSVLAGGGLLSKKGRKTVSRCAGETFYGTLHSFTGICSSNYNDEVGSGGGSPREI